MAQPNAILTVKSVVRIIPGTATPVVPTDEGYLLTSTVGNYATDMSAYATQIWNFLVASGYVVQSTTTTVDQLTAVPTSGGANASLEAIECIARVQNVTAPEPHYEQQAYSPEQEERTDFEIGPADFADAATLATALSAAVAKGLKFTNY